MDTNLPLNLTKFQYAIMAAGHQAANADFLIAPMGLFSLGISKRKVPIPDDVQLLVDKGWLKVFDNFTNQSYMAQLTPEGRLIAKMIAP